jgi:hypothetical protein
MKRPFSAADLPTRSVLITCSSHESRCRGVTRQLGNWAPKTSVLFHYDDDNPRREENHRLIKNDLERSGVAVNELRFTEGDAVKSLRDNMRNLRDILLSLQGGSIVLDVSVLTKRHLLMMLQWLDDEGAWERLVIAYSEPEDYDVSEYIPLSFGLSSLQQTPGFSACADLSRPVHLVLFLGYEGDRALAVYEHVQPMRTTLVIPDPPFRSAWSGRTERFNADLLALVGNEPPERVESIDPAATTAALDRILGDGKKRGERANFVCPLGTKPQTVGLYEYLRRCVDPPAIIYAGPLRHNHEFFSHGIGATWLLKAPETHETPN